MAPERELANESICQHFERLQYPLALVLMHLWMAASSWAASHRKKLRELLEDCRIADAVYEDTPEQFAEKTVLERDNILQFEHEADHFRAAYSIALLPDSKEVRGHHPRRFVINQAVRHRKCRSIDTSGYRVRTRHQHTANRLRGTA